MTQIWVRWIMKDAHVIFSTQIPVRAAWVVSTTGYQTISSRYSNKSSNQNNNTQSNCIHIYRSAVNKLLVTEEQSRKKPQHNKTTTNNWIRQIEITYSPSRKLAHNDKYTNNRATSRWKNKPKLLPMWWPQEGNFCCLVIPLPPPSWNSLIFTYS